MRTKARTRWERAIQVIRWLKTEFPLPEDLGFRVALFPPGDDDLGALERDENTGRLTIALSSRGCKTVNEAVETAIHEAAHAVLYDRGFGHLHGPVYWKTFGTMMDAFDHHGHQESRAFPVD